MSLCFMHAEVLVLLVLWANEVPHSVSLVGIKCSEKVFYQHGS